MNWVTDWIEVTFDDKFFKELQDKLVATNNEDIGIKCAKAQFNLLQNVRAQIDRVLAEVNQLRAENITLQVANASLRRRIEKEENYVQDQQEERDAPPV